MSESCSKCAYSRSTDQGGRGSTLKCCRNPPVLVLDNQPQLKSDPNERTLYRLVLVSRFPSVRAEAWCGAYEEK